MDSKIILKIAAGIVAGGLILFIARIAIVGAGMSFMYDKTTETMQGITSNSIRQSQEIKDRAANEARMKVQARLAEFQRQQEQARMETQKEQAFFEWYKAPKGCEHWDSDTEMVRCTNDSMRARKEFDQVWVGGKVESKATL